MYHHLIQRFKQACFAALCCVSLASSGQAEEFFFPTTNTMTAPRNTHQIQLLPDGRVFLQGDLPPQTSPTTSASIDIYNPVSNRFSRVSSLALARWQNGSALLADGRVMITGGRTNTTLESVAALTEIYNPISNTVTPAANLLIPRGFPKATALLDGRVLISGGNMASNISVLRTEIYNPNTDTYTFGGFLTYPRLSVSTATLLADGRVLLVGGSGVGATVPEIFEPVSNTVSVAGTLIEPRTGGHTVTLLQNGKVLIVGGGLTASVITAKAEVYDPATMTSTLVGNLITARRGHTATLLPDGRVLIAGGTIPAGDGGVFYTGSTEIFDPISQTFSAGPTMLATRENARAVMLQNGQVLITGGRTPSLVTTAEVFDTEITVSSADWYALLQSVEDLTFTLNGVQAQLITANDAINGLTLTNSTLQGQLASANGTITGLVTTNAQLQARLDELQPNPFRLLPDTLPPRPRILTFSLPDGRVLLMSTITSEVPATRSAGIYDPQTGSMITAGGMNEARVGQTGNLLPDGRVLFAGGSIRSLPSGVVVVTNSTEIYNVSTSNSVPGPNMVYARIAAGSVNLPDGRFLVFGGRNASTPFVAQSEIFEPTNNAFRPSGVMPEVLNLATATLLQDGRVLIYGSSTNATPVIQIYNPATEIFNSVTGPSTGRIGHQATLLADGKVMISGGRTVIGGQILNTTEIFNPVTGTFSTGPNMLLGRQNFTSTTLLDGTVLVTGGQTNTASNFPATIMAEIFDPAQGAFSSAGVMQTNQFFHAGVLLPNGTVLLTGGMSGIGTGLLFKSQIYDPVKLVRLSEFNNLNLLIDDLEAENTSLSSQLASVQTALVNANATISGLVVTNAQLQQELADCQAEKAALIAQINTLTNQIAQLQGTIATLTAQNNALTNQVAQQQATIITLGTQVNSLTNQVATLTAQNNALTNQVAQLQSTVSSLQTQNNALTNQVATLTAQNAAQAATITQQQAALSAEQANSQALAAQVAQQQALIASLQAQNTTLTNQVATLTTANQQLQTQVTGTQTQVNALNSAFQSEFSDPTFVIPGATLQEQVQYLINAILDLTHGQRKAVYDNLD